VPPVCASTARLHGHPKRHASASRPAAAYAPPAPPYHLMVDGHDRRLMIAALRYLDAYAKVQGVWQFAERRLYVDWLEERTL
jgi:hypothetical protein